MGKTGSWFSAIKRVFAPNSREKFGHGTNKRASKERNKWGIGKLKPGENNSFIPLYREPSSIEKILGDAERENQTLRDLPTRDHQRTPSFSSRDPQSQRSLPSKVEEKPFVTPPNVYQPRPANYSPGPKPNLHQRTPSFSSRDPQSQRSLPSKVEEKPFVTPPNVYQPKPANYSPGPKPNLHLTLAAIRIQTAYRGYSARRSYRALKGLVRLQGVMRGQSVKRQTMKAMKCLQQVVRVQSQIHSWRVQMMESQAQQRQNLQKSDNDQDSNLGKWCPTPHSEKDDQDQEWDDSVLTKEEREARLQRKVGAVIKRERQLAYAYSHQLWKATPKTAHAALMEIRSGGQPWLWNWVERHVPTPTPADAPGRTPTKVHTPSRTPTYQRTPKQVLQTLESGTPKSLRSSPAPKSRPLKNIIGGKVSRTEFSARTPLRDDESLTSCPPFSEPSYMAPTESAKAKARAQSNLNERSASTPSGKTKKRMTFALGQSIGSIRWSKGMSLFSGTDSGSKVKGGGTPEAIHSIGNLSVDSTSSLPAAVGSKPFRFK